MKFFTFYKLWFVKTTFLRIKKLQARRFVKNTKYFFHKNRYFIKTIAI